MHFYKSAVALSTLFATLVLASPTPRTTCTGKVWGVSDPSVTWEYVGIERNTTEINEILFDTSYALSASCPTSGLDTATWWVEDASTCGATSLAITQISITVDCPPPGYLIYGNGGDGSVPVTVECPAGCFIYTQAVFHGNIAAQVDAQTLWVLEVGVNPLPPPATSTSTTAHTKTTTSHTTSTTASGGGRGTAAHWGQCGGIGWTGPTQCVAGTTCQSSGPYYSHCL